MNLAPEASSEANAPEAASSEAEKDRKDREAIVAALDAQLKKGDKALVGNSAYRRYLLAARDRSAWLDAHLLYRTRFDAHRRYVELKGIFLNRAGIPMARP